MASQDLTKSSHDSIRRNGEDRSESMFVGSESLLTWKAKTRISYNPTSDPIETDGCLWILGSWGEEEGQPRQMEIGGGYLRRRVTAEGAASAPDRAFLRTRYSIRLKISVAPFIRLLRPEKVPPLLSFAGARLP